MRIRARNPCHVWKSEVINSTRMHILSLFENSETSPVSLAVGSFPEFFRIHGQWLCKLISQFWWDSSEVEVCEMWPDAPTPLPWSWAWYSSSGVCLYTFQFENHYSWGRKTLCIKNYAPSTKGGAWLFLVIFLAPNNFLNQSFCGLSRLLKAQLILHISIPKHPSYRFVLFGVCFWPSAPSHC